jgi:hypothetical protein
MKRSSSRSTIAFVRQRPKLVDDAVRPGSQAGFGTHDMVVNPRS